MSDAVTDKLPDTKAEPWSSARIYDALKLKYAAPEYAMLFEVPDGTGSHKSRSADALAMSLWPSRGLHLIGFEVKASRSDWAREKANPAKAEAIAKHCDYWYVVAGSASIVGPGELPPTWGLIVPKGDKLVVKVEAPKLEPVPVDRSFLAGIFRRASEKFENVGLMAETIQRERNEGYKQGQEQADKGRGYELKRAREELARLRGTVADFEKSSGVKVDQWGSARPIGEAVRIVLDGKYAGSGKRLEWAAGEFRQIAESMDRLRSVMDAMEPRP